MNGWVVRVLLLRVQLPRCSNDPWIGLDSSCQLVLDRDTLLFYFLGWTHSLTLLYDFGTIFFTSWEYFRYFIYFHILIDNLLNASSTRLAFLGWYWMVTLQSFSNSIYCLCLLFHSLQVKSCCRLWWSMKTSLLTPYN